MERSERERRDVEREMGNQQTNRLPKGREMMTLGHLNALLNNHKQALSESVDLLNFRIERMIKRLGGDAGWRSAKLPLFRSTYLHRTLFVSFLERYQNGLSYRLYQDHHLPWSIDSLANMSCDVLCETLKLKRNSVGLKLVPSTCWSLTKDFDTVVEFYTFLICLSKRVFMRYFRADPQVNLDELRSETLQVLFRRIDEVDFDSEGDIIKALYEVSGFRSSRKPKPLFIQAQRKHWVSRLNRAFAGCGQNSRLTETEIRALFGDVVDHVNWVPPVGSELKRLRKIYEPPPPSMSDPPPSFDVVILEDKAARQRRLANHGKNLMRRSMTTRNTSDFENNYSPVGSPPRRRHSSASSGDSIVAPGKILLFRGFSKDGSCHL